MSFQKAEQIRRPSEKSRSTRLTLLFWAIFGAGLVIQVAAPRLKIENNTFVMAPISDSRGGMLRPDRLVRRERWMQLASGILSVGGALALGVCYRQRLLAGVRG